MKTTLHDVKSRFLEAFLAKTPFEGWSETAARWAAKDLAKDETCRGVSLATLFPEGLWGLTDFYLQDLDDKMEAACRAQKGFEDLRVHEKVKAALLHRLALMAPHREAVYRLASFLSLPHHWARGTEKLYRMVGRIWYLAGDNATDYNFYTKRFLLAGVYSSTLLYWLQGDHDDKAVEDFLDRRLQNVLMIHKTKQKFQNWQDDFCAAFPFMKKKPATKESAPQ